MKKIKLMLVAFMAMVGVSAFAAATPWATTTYKYTVEGKIVTRDIDLAVVAVGVSPNPIVPKSVEGLELGRKNTIAVNEKMQSNIPTIFAGGDIVRGGATVILAMGDGRKAAANIDAMLKEQA